MTSPTPISSSTLPDRDGNIVEVRKGDKVSLRPYSPTYSPEKKVEDLNYDEFQEFESRRRMETWLGEGPYPISWMGRWPCGRIMIYVKTWTSSGSGVYSRDLMFVERGEEKDELSSVVNGVSDAEELGGSE